MVFIRLFIVLILVLILPARRLYAQDCNTGCKDLYDAQGEIKSGDKCKPVFGLNTIAGTACLGKGKCLEISNYFLYNPPETQYIFNWGDGTVDTWTHEQLKSIPQETDPVFGPFRRVCHAYQQATCPDEKKYEIKVEQLNPNSNCTNSIAPENIRVITPTQVDFTFPEFSCVNQGINIVNTSIEGYNIDCKKESTYHWDVGNDGTIDRTDKGLKSFMYPGFSTPGVKEVKLTGYNDPKITCGESTVVKKITILNIPKPQFDIGSGAELQPVVDCKAANLFAFKTSEACVNVSLPLKNTTTNRNATTSFLWSVSPTAGAVFQNNNLTQDTNTIQFTQAGKYEVRLTVNDQCAAGLSGQNYACITVIVKDKPNVKISANAKACTGNPFTATIDKLDMHNLLPADILGVTWAVVKTSSGGLPVPAFVNGAELLTIDAMPAGTYSISAVYKTICGDVNMAPITVEIFEKPQVNISLSKESVCPDEKFVITADNATAETYSWFENNVLLPVQSLPALNRQHSTPGEYTYRLDITKNGCPGSSNTVKVKVNSLASMAGINVDRPTFCADEAVDFNLQANGVTPVGTPLYWQTCTVCDGTDWANINGATTLVYNGNVPGTFRARLDAAGCFYNSEPIVIVQRRAILATLKISGGDTSICAGGNGSQISVDVQSGPGNVTYSYTWQKDGRDMVGAVSNQLTVTAAGNYTATVRQDAICPEQTDPVAITVDPKPTFTVSGAPGSYCSGAQASIQFTSAIPNLVYQWKAQPNANLSPITPSGYGNILQTVQNNASSFQTLTYMVSAQNPATGCTSDTAQVLVEIAPILMLQVPATANICNNDLVMAEIRSTVTEVITYDIQVSQAGPGVGGARPVTETNQTGLYLLSQKLTNSSDTPQQVVYSIKAKLNKNGVLCESQLHTLTVTVRPTPKLVFDSAAADTVICSGTTLRLNFQTSPPGSVITFRYIDNPRVTGEQSGTGNVLTQSLLSDNDRTDEIVVYQIGVESDGCNGIAREIHAVVNPRPRIDIVSAQNDTIVCGNGSFQSTINAASSVANSTFRWLNSSNQVVSPSATLSVSATGTYYAEATTAGLCTSKRSVTIARRPLAMPVIDTVGISTSNPRACPGDTVFLRAMPMGVQAITTYQWFFNGQPISGAIFSMLPATQSGSYAVHINNDSPCPETASPAVVVFPPEPDPAIEGLLPSICPETKLLSLRASNGNPAAPVVEYDWQVMPATLATIDDRHAMNPTLFVNDNKTGNDIMLTVGLTLTSADGCRKSKVETLELTSRPVAGFDIDDEICESTQLLPRDKSQFADSLHWYASPAAGVFIDRPRTSNPGITFPAITDRSSIKIYTIKQITFRKGCADSLDGEITVHPAPQAGFTTSTTPHNNCGPVTGVFTSTSTGVGLVHQWSFSANISGDDATSVTRVFPPDTVTRHYIVRLEIASGVCGTSVASDTIMVRPIPKISKLLLSPALPVCADFPLAISYAVVGQPDEVVFDFGDGSSLVRKDSIDAIDHLYRNNTKKDTTFTLTITAISECTSTTRQRTIVVSPNKVTAFYEASTAEVCQFTEVKFSNNQFASSGNQVIWNWGDGEITTGDINTKHVYNTPGVFYPALIVKNGCHVDTCSVQTSPACGIAVRVLETPPAVFEIDRKACHGVPVSFRNGSPLLTMSAWSFGDGSTSSKRDPEPHLYPKDDTYSVTLEIENEHGCKSAAEHQVTVHPLPVPGFTLPQGPACEGSVQYFANTSAGAISYRWMIDSLNYHSLSKDVAVTFPKEGIYTVTLAVFDAENQTGCSDSTSRSLAIGQMPVPEFLLTQIDVSCDITTFFIKNETLIPEEGEAVWAWDFGNSESSDRYLSQGITQAYSNTMDAESEFVVSLSVTHVNGCSATKTEGRMLAPFREDIVLPPARQLICFTPGQSPNEEFKLRYDNVDESDFRMAIYNQWGNEVFITDDIESAWNGFYNGQVAAVGVYVAKVTFKGCKSQQKKEKFISICIRN